MGKWIRFSTMFTQNTGGTNWKLGKGKPALHNKPLLGAYIDLWRAWADLNGGRLQDLCNKASKSHYILTDQFATSEVNQAHALAVILNERGLKSK